MKTFINETQKQREEALDYIYSLLSNRPTIVLPNDMNNIAMGLSSVCKDVINRERASMEDMKSQYEFDRGVVSVLQEQKTSLENVTSSLRASITDIENSIKDLGLEKAKVLREIEDARRELASLAEQVASSKKDAETASENKGKLFKDVRDLQAKKDGILKEIDELTAKRTAAEEKMSACTARLKSVQETYTSASANLTEVEKKIDLLVSRTSQGKETYMVVWEEIGYNELYRYSYYEFHRFMDAQIKKYADIMGVSIAEAEIEFRTNCPCMAINEISYRDKMRGVVIRLPRYVKCKSPLSGDIQISLGERKYSIEDIINTKGALALAQAEAQAWKTVVMRLLELARQNGNGEIAEEIIGSQFGFVEPASVKTIENK